MQLCTQALDAEGEEQAREILLELRSLLHDRIQELRGSLALVHSKATPFPEEWKEPRRKCGT